MVRSTSSAQRPAVVLLIVITMLALFAAVGLAFVYYAGAEADAAKTALQAEIASRPDVNPEMLLSYFLGQLIYDTDDIYSAMRGHSLSRSMYGYNPLTLNTIPFNGTGRLHYPVGGPDNYFLLNYTYYGGNFRRDPELFGSYDPKSGGTPGPYIGGANVPWTYPDMQSPFLGAVNAQGEVLISSFSRPWAGGTWNSGDPSYYDPWNRYFHLRPHPSYHTFTDLAGNTTKFPDSDEYTGGTIMPPDVKNLEDSIGTRKPGGGHWMNDSYWMDLGFPVMTGPNGKKYKPLFAPLIIDLDGKVNAAIHGNIKGAGTHVSNQGWGRWEVNLEKVLANPGEAKKLLEARYGPNKIPGDATSIFTPPNPGPFFAPLDLDAVNSGVFQLPVAGQVTCFPTYPPPPGPPLPGYDNGSTTGAYAETKDHPAIYRYFPPYAADDLPPLAASNMEALIRYRGTGSSAMTSSLFRLMPLSLANPRTRRQLTTLSSDLNAAGAAPWNCFDFNPFDTAKYSPFFNTLVAAGVPVYFSPYRVFNNVSNFPYYAGGSVALFDGLKFPPLPPAQWPNSEFGPAWNSTLAWTNIPYTDPVSPTLKRIDLNRTLKDYPAPNNGLIDLSIPGSPTTLQYQKALGDRQELAKDLYRMLIKVTGAMDPNLVAAPVADPTDPVTSKDKQEAYNNVANPLASTQKPLGSLPAARWLAQLAVNIVDYIDNDDYITFFDWYPGNPDVNDRFVYGTELPRLIVNESYAQLDDDPGDPTKIRLNVWAELHNTFMADTGANYPRDKNRAYLQYNSRPNDPGYRLVISAGDPSLQSVTNPKGTVQIASIFGTVSDWNNGTAADIWIEPSDGNYSDPSNSNKGFYVAAPNVTFAAAQDPNLPKSYATATMSFSADKNAPLAQLGGQKLSDILATPGVTLVLQRLACPHVPFNVNTNPFITVDFFEGVQVHPAMGPNLRSKGRSQPYAGYLAFDQAPVPPPGGQPKHTFFRHNAVENTAPPSATKPGQTLKTPFDWLVHLDRPLVSPMELLHVSAFPPHLLTQKFVADNGGGGFGSAHNHRASWFGHYTQNPPSWDRQETLLYRLFEMVYTHDLANPASYRQPGKINLNTVWDRETFRALCAATPGGFTQAEVDQIFTKLRALRSPTVAGNGPIGPTSDDFPAAMIPAGQMNLPLKSLATGYSPPGIQLPNGQDINSTLLRDDGSATYTQSLDGGPLPKVFKPRLLEVPGQTHPYKKYELLNKIFNNSTVRSNVFAVWVTVGFFEAFDEMSGNISSAASTPVVVSTATAHGLSSGDAVRISGVQGNTGANGNWIITALSPTSFQLNGSTSTGAYTANTGIWTIPLKPAKLGKEIGRDEGRNVRHRMFAIIDRTQMLLPDYPATTLGAAIPAIGLQPVNINPFNSVELQPTNGTLWKANIVAGMKVEIERGSGNAEVVTVTGVNASPLSITANFTKTHPNNSTIHIYTPSAVLGPPVSAKVNNALPLPVGTFYGNPGPQGRFDHRNATAVVPHYSIIE